MTRETAWCRGAVPSAFVLDSAFSELSYAYYRSSRRSSLYKVPRLRYTAATAELSIFLWRFVFSSKRSEFLVLLSLQSSSECCLWGCWWWSGLSVASAWTLCPRLDTEYHSPSLRRRSAHQQYHEQSQVPSAHKIHSLSTTEEKKNR